MLKLKACFLLITLFSIKLFAIEVVLSNQNINYNEIITDKMIKTSSVKKLRRHCTPVKYNEFIKKKLQASHYMKKGFVICTDDIKEYKKKSVLFDFGVIQIEKQGEIIFENDEYIRIKRSNGDIEKIYKDGRIK